MLGIVLASAFSVQGPIPCRIVNAADVDRMVSQILTSSESDARSRMSDLVNLWKSECLESRKSAGKEVVTSLLPLLQIVEFRALTVQMLRDIDVGIGVSVPNLEVTLSEQEALERAQRLRAAPITPTTSNFISQSIRCVLWKIRYHTHNENLCRYLDQTGSDTEEAQ